MSWWKNDAVANEQPAPQRGGVFIADQGAIDDARRADTSLGIQVRGEERAGRREDKDAADTAFANSAALRKEFGAIPAVKNFNEAVTALDTALQTKADGNGDATLLYQYSKLMDPMGSVREGDIEIAQSGASVVSGKLAALKKEFNIGGGGSLPQSVRDGLRREMISRAISLRDAYNQERNRYREMAAGFGFDPDSAIGPHAAAPFRERWREYDRANGLGEFAPGRELQSSVLNPAGGRAANEQDNAALGPGDKFLYDESGSPIAIQSADGTISGYSQVIDEVSQREAEAAARERYGDDYGTRASSLIKGASFNLSDEAAGVLGGIYDTVTGGSFAEGYGRERDIERAVQDKSRQDYGIGWELLGGLAVPGAALKVAGGGKNLATAGGVAGGIAGFGEGEGLPGSLTTALIGAAGGAATGYGGQKLIDAGKATGIPQRISSAFARKPSQKQQAAADYVEAAGRQEIVPFVGDVDTRAAAAAGKLAQTQAGVGPVTRAAERTLETTGAARDRLARAIGEPLQGEAFGYRMSEGAKKAIAREHDAAQSLYRAAESKAQGLSLTPETTQAVLAREIATIADTGLGDKAVGIFGRVQDRLAQGPVSVETLRNIRTQIREDLATEGLRGGKADAAARKVMSAITDDIDTALRSNGLSEAADLFKRADDSWAAYSDLTDNVIAPLVGKKGEFSGETVAKRLQADLRGNNARAAHFLRALPAEEQTIARSSIVQSLGSEADGSFNFSKFVKHWDDIGDSAKDAFFGAELRSALNDIAIVSRGAKQSQRWANHSNSGGAFNAPLETIAAFGSLGGTMLATNVTARMLTSKTMVKWLAAAAKKPNEKALDAHAKRLTAIARAEPVIANDILSLQERLAQSFAQPSALRSAAEEDDKLREPPPAQGERGNAP